MPGMLADLAVLSDDYFSVPISRIGQIQSLLTMVGGKVVYASGPFSDLESRSQRIGVESRAMLRIRTKQFAAAFHLEMICI